MSALHESLSASLATAPGGVQPDWFTGLKARASGQFDAIGLPDKKTEQWKYTSLYPLESKSPGLGMAQDSTTSVPAAPMLASAGPGICMINGRFSSVQGELPQGLQVLPLAQAIDAGEPGLKAMLEALDFSHKGLGFSALNTATLGEGILLRVLKRKDAGTVSLLWQQGADAGAQLFNSRVCILLEPGAKLHLLEQYETGEGQSSLLNVVLQADISKNAELLHTRFQQQSSDSFLVTRTEARQSEDCRFHSTGVDMGDGVARHDVRSVLAGVGASCTLNGVCLTGGSAHADHHLEAVHDAKDCTSEQTFRAIADGRSRVVFNGKVHIRQGADGADASQSSAGLLLSAMAEIDAKPELEIYADEVMANHGATVGQLDETAMFYMRSRGLSEDQARSLLTRAFCRSVTDQLKDEAVKISLGERLTGKLEKAGV